MIFINKQKSHGLCCCSLLISQSFGSSVILLDFADVKLILNFFQLLFSPVFVAIRQHEELATNDISSDSGLLFLNVNNFVAILVFWACFLYLVQIVQIKVLYNISRQL